MSKRGKKYNEALALIDKNKQYPLSEAIDLLKQTSKVKFDATCEVHMNLGVNPKHAEQMVRSTVVLPNGIGKDVRVCAFVPDDLVAKAKKAGAAFAGNEDLIEKVANGWFDFDIAVATPDMMRNLAKVAKNLGQKGLMPNPKAGTISLDIETMISDIRKGKVEFRTDKLSNLHNVFGKVSFDTGKLQENIKVYLKAVMDNKPLGLKGTYVKSLFIKTTMGPSIALNIQETLSSL